MSDRPARQPYHILIRDLDVDCSIGVYGHEHLAPQRVRLNIDMTVAEPGDGFDDDIARVVSYEDVISAIRAMATRQHINLVETLAERIAALCLADPRVSQTRVRVEKLDIYAGPTVVGVELERRRADGQNRMRSDRSEDCET
jgi:7,8-dihydroneopterin aldolase/epimerase/oxygenase